MFRDCDVSSKGGLALPELSRFISLLSYNAAVIQAATQQDLTGQPTALRIQATAPAFAGNLLAAGASADDVGATCVYLAARAMVKEPVLTWDAFMSVLQQFNERLPTVIRCCPKNNNNNNNSNNNRISADALEHPLQVYKQVNQSSSRDVSPARQHGFVMNAATPVTYQGNIANVSPAMEGQHGNQSCDMDMQQQAAACGHLQANSSQQHQHRLSSPVGVASQSPGVGANMGALHQAQQLAASHPDALMSRGR